MSSLATGSGAVNLLVDTINHTTRVEVRASRASNIDVLNRDVLANLRAGALQVPDKGVVLLGRCAVEVADLNVGDCEVGWSLMSR
jgi:hypothetical protein